MAWIYNETMKGEIVSPGFRYAYDGRQWDTRVNDFWQWLELVEVGGEDRLLFHPAQEEVVRLDASNKYRLLPTGLKHQDVLDGMGVIGETPGEPGEPGEPDTIEDEICPRCGASIQATHHPLCQAKDGTPTKLPDSLVRKAITLHMEILDYIGMKGTKDEALYVADLLHDAIDDGWYVPDRHPRVIDTDDNMPF